MQVPAGGNRLIYHLKIYYEILHTFRTNRFSMNNLYVINAQCRSCIGPDYW